MAKKPSKQNKKPQPGKPARLEARVLTPPPPPAPVTFKQKLAVILNQGQKKSINPSQLAQATSEVREGVMLELRRQGTGSKPFQNILLPTLRYRKPGVPRWLLGSLAALLALALLVWWVGRAPTGAELALHHVQNAIAERNAAEFERLVDVPALSQSVVAQVYAPQSTSGMGFEDSVRLRLQKLMHAEPSAAMAATLHDQILSAVAAGRWPDEPGSLLGQLWQQLGGENLRVGHSRAIASVPAAGAGAPALAEAELPLSRADINLDVALKLVLRKTDNRWQLIDAPNLAQVLALTDEAEAAAMADENDTSPAAGPMPAVTADVLSAAKDKNGNVTARLNLANLSGLPVRGLSIALTIGDAAGTPLKQIMLTETAELASTASVEKVYTIPVDAKNPYEKFIAALPLTALTVRASVVGVRQ